MSANTVGRVAPAIDEWTEALQRLRGIRNYFDRMPLHPRWAADHISGDLRFRLNVDEEHRGDPLKVFGIDAETKAWLDQRAAQYRLDADRMAEIAKPIIQRLDELIKQAERSREKLYRERRKQQVAEKRFLRDETPSLRDIVKRERTR